MSIIFLIYFLAFLSVIKKSQKLAYLLFGIATISSILMFLYHSDSTLNLSF
ncbi:DUF5993 family protein [Xanthomarina sp. F1114]|uniref:DUF5993 family protein n=1 Tax=Xanthomarina sp. F1114 TaxID=2996019 RepID=UPI003A4C54B4